ncbi:hypothetical protein [Couchioplanes azureus]|uniref:hypothetical protein n=1 Tax=Couchioplanes caeruleus TaxID=56438 RepID=UPI001889C41D|nr:hypothetical protein [Couchioplanes caeruleus]GGQ68381.1 hypothetical protein GCM10010166_43030 [Couchioplanes caeruleus subsp. azureus]
MARPHIPWKMLVAACLAIPATVVAATPAAAAARTGPVTAEDRVLETPGTMTSTVSGTFTDATSAAGTVHGTFAPERFEVAGDGIVAVGLLAATLVDSTGETVGSETQSVSLPLLSGTASATGAEIQAFCPILDLVLGPLDLDLLGLRVHLDRVHLNITAVSGPGDLLGNLLCAVAGLLDPIRPPLQAIVDLLNQILSILRS